MKTTLRPSVLPPRRWLSLPCASRDSLAPDVANKTSPGLDVLRFRVKGADEPTWLGLLIMRQDPEPLKP